MAEKVGFQVEEGISSGVTPFIGASKSNIGLIMERKRGVPNKPIMVTSLQEDRKLFGGIAGSQFGAYVTRHLFNNAGKYGALVYGVRIVDDTSLAASGSLNQETEGAGAPTCTVTVTQAASEPATPQLTTFATTNVLAGDIIQIGVGADLLSITVTEGAAASATTLCDFLVTTLNAHVLNNPTGAMALAGTVFSNVANVLTATTPTASGEVTFSGEATRIEGAIIEFEAGQHGLADPGTWGNDLSVRVIPAGHAQGLVGNIVAEVSYGGSLVEVWQGETFESLIDSINANSEYIRASSGEAIAATITDIATVAFSGGTYVAPVEADFYAQPDSVTPAGLSCFDGLDVQVIACTEHHTQTMAAELKTYVENRQDCIAVVNLPYLSGTSTVQTWAAAFQSALSSFLAPYNFWVKTSNESGGSAWVPSIGVILGAGFIRTMMMNRGNVWTPPGGTDSVFNDVMDISPNPLSQPIIDLWVKRYTTNVAVFKKGIGFFLYSSRTYSTNPLYHSIHIRRMTNWIVATMDSNMQFTIQRPNTPELARDAVVSLKMFGKEMYDNGGLERSISLEEAWIATSDRSNNPVGQDRKLRNIDVEWIPTECTESVRVRLNRNDGSLIVKELNS